MAPDQVLGGIRVLDLSALLPGPYCSRLLADLGAEVIKVERPGVGDWIRDVPPLRDGESNLHHLLNSGKKCLTLDLKSEAGKEAFLRLIARSDVLLETFRPGVMDRLALGDEVLCRTNSRLVHCALSGYGAEGGYRERAGHDLNYVALSGLLDLTGRTGEAPVPIGAPIADLTGGMWALIGILGALFARAADGMGRRVDASLLGASVACLPVALAGQMGGQPVRRGEGMLTGGLVCYQVYACKDDGYMSLAALEPEFWASFCRAVDREDLLDAQYARAVSGKAAYDSLCALFATRTSQEWAEFFSDQDCCCEPVYSLEEGMGSPAVRALGMIKGGALLPPIRIGPYSGGVEPPAGGLPRGPRVGEHTEPILREICGYTAEEIQRLRERGVA